MAPTGGKRPRRISRPRHDRRARPAGTRRRGASVRDIIAAALLVASVAGVLAACLGAWRAAGPLDGQHFTSAAATVPPVLLGAAVVVREGISSAAVLTMLTVATLVVTGGALASAFGHAVAGELSPQDPCHDSDEAGS